MEYRHILIATDLHQENIEVALKAQQLAKHYSASLSLVHVVESLLGYASSYGGIANLEEEIKQEAIVKLAELGQRVGVDVASQHLDFGSPKIIILEVAKNINADLLIVGSHGRHGLGLLLGSTASAIVHAAHIDILVVHLKKEKM